MEAEAADAKRWRCLDVLLTREGRMCGTDFEPAQEIRPFLQNDCRVLVVGAGGLGCELLKDLALSGFGHIDVIDMDTIDVSNLNRQFLFRPKDVGKTKAEVAAAAVMKRVKGVDVVPHVGRIEDKPTEWYEQFHVFVLGLDSLEARGWMNALACGMLKYEADGSPDLSTVKPIVDGGTEGFKGHSRVIYPGFTPCFECTMWLFPPQTKFPLCTLAETPRNAAHCIEYAHLIQWGNEREEESFDSDNPQHIQWVYQKALQRADSFGISGVTLSHTQGVVKNIIPAIASTNAIVAASCALETLKAVTLCSKGLDNYMMYVGSEGVYTHTVPYQRDPDCLVCSPGILFTVSRSATLRAFMEILVADDRLKGQVSGPSVSFNGKNLYMRSPPVLEEMTRSNLELPLYTLMAAGDEGATLMVNDSGLKAPLRVRVAFSDDTQPMAQ